MLFRLSLGPRGGCYKLQVTYRAFLVLETRMLLQVVYYPEGPVTG